MKYMKPIGGKSRMIYPKVAIITSTYNQRDKLFECLDSLKKLDYPNYKVYFMDDSGTGEIAREVKERFPKVQVLYNELNKGYSSSVNSLIEYSIIYDNPDYFWHIDDDTEIRDKDILKELINFAEKRTDAGILGCKVSYPNGELQWYYTDKIHFEKVPNNNIIFKEMEEARNMVRIHEVSEVIGACFLIKRAVIDRVGMFDEGFNPAYGEESDLCMRARKRGFRCYYVGSTSIIHKQGSSLKGDSDLKWYLKKRNGIRLEWLNYPFSRILVNSFIHYGSAFRDNKVKLLWKAYKHNFNNLSEIREKRRERNENKSIFTMWI